MLPKLAFLAFAIQTSAFDYDIIGGGSIVLSDVATQISPLSTLFVDEAVNVVADGLEWEANGGNFSSTGTLFFETFLDGKLVASGNQSLAEVGRSLPTSVDAGTLTVPKGGRYTISVVMKVDDSEASASGEYEAYGAGVAILPLIVILLLAVVTNMVRRRRHSKSISIFSNPVSFTAPVLSPRLFRFFSLCLGRILFVRWRLRGSLHRFWKH